MDADGSNNRPLINSGGESYESGRIILGFALAAIMTATLQTGESEYETEIYIMVNQGAVNLDKVGAVPLGEAGISSEISSILEQYGAETICRATPDTVKILIKAIFPYSHGFLCAKCK